MLHVSKHGTIIIGLCKLEMFQCVCPSKMFYFIQRGNCWYLCVLLKCNCCVQSSFLTLSLKLLLRSCWERGWPQKTWDTFVNYPWRDISWDRWEGGGALRPDTCGCLSAAYPLLVFAAGLRIYVFCRIENERSVNFSFLFCSLDKALAKVEKLSAVFLGSVSVKNCLCCK